MGQLFGLKMKRKCEKSQDEERRFLPFLCPPTVSVSGKKVLKKTGRFNTLKQQEELTP